MSQRNPMNDRYTTDGPKGQTRKSAASAKPKTKAASSVRVQPAEKTKEQKKAERKAREKEERQKQREMDARFYNPPTPQYKKLRRIWWGFLIAAIICTAISFIGREMMPSGVAFAILILAYVFIIGAFYIDFSRIKKVRRAYQAEMEALANTKEGRAAAKAQAKAEQEEAERKFAEAQAAKAEKEAAKKNKRGFFGSGFRLANKEKADAEKKAASEQADADDGEESGSANTKDAS